MSDPPESDACPACGSPRTVRAFHARDLALRAVAGEFPYRRCRNCGSVFQAPQPTDAQLRRAYPSSYGHYRQAHALLERLAAPLTMPEVRRFMRHSDSSGHLIELGAGSGQFLERLKRCGWTGRMEAIELDESAAGALAQRMGIPVRAANLDREVLPAASYDAIVMRHVLEHVRRPADTLEMVYRALRPGGVLLVGTPDARALSARMFGRHWWGYEVPRHLVVFSSDALVSLLQRVGFEPLDRWSGFSPLMWTASLGLLLADRREPRWWHRMAGSPFNPVTAAAFGGAAAVEATLGRSTMLSVVARRPPPSARPLARARRLHDRRAARRHPPAKRRRVSESTFVVLVNGTFGAPPATGVLEYLLAEEARRVTAVSHPLTAEDGDRHEITTYESGRDPRRRGFSLPARPPYTYPLDVVVPPRLPRADVWVAFNNLLCARGLLERRVGRAGQVLYWAVDFVPDRFGKDSPLTRAYDACDALCCRHVDLRVELSAQALAGRDARLRLGAEEGAPRVIAPVGAWVDRVPVVPEDGFRSRRVVFIGHLVERMGVDTVLEAMAVLAERGVDVTADIAGHGPEEQQLRDQSARHGLDDRVRFHGFISDHRRLERLLSEAAVALAPYSTRVESFTRYADPSKLKSYLAAGLPILLTDVPPNAHDLVAHAGAQLIADDPLALADAIECTLADRADWQRRRLQARQYARQFDWSNIVGGVLKLVGFES